MRPPCPRLADPSTLLLPRLLGHPPLRVKPVVPDPLPGPPARASREGGRTSRPVGVPSVACRHGPPAVLARPPQGHIEVGGRSPSSSTSRSSPPRRSDPASWLEMPSSSASSVRRQGSVIAVVAPAGLRQDDAAGAVGGAQTRPGGVVSVDDRDNDPTVLLTYSPSAIDRVEPIGPRPSGSPRRAGLADVPRLGSVMAAMSEPVAIVLDHVEALDQPRVPGRVAELALRLPAGSSSPSAPQDAPLPVPRLRAQGGIVEVGAGDLAMTRGARPARTAPGVDLTETEVGALVERTEGWPAGLYLAALAMKAGARRATPAPHVHRRRPLRGRLPALGDPRPRVAGRRVIPHPHVGPRAMCGPLCDVTVGAALGAGPRAARAQEPPARAAGSARRVVPLPPTVPGAAGCRTAPSGAGDDPRTPPPRRGRGARRNGQPEAAIDHARRPGMPIGSPASSFNWPTPSGPAAGSTRSSAGWSGSPAGPRRAVPRRRGARRVDLALIGPRATPSAGRRRPSAPRPGHAAGRQPIEASLAYLRALAVPRRPRRDAHATPEAALDGLSPTSPYRATMLHTEGLAHLLEGDLIGPTCSSPAPSTKSSSAGDVPFVPLVLAERGIVAFDRVRLDGGRRSPTQALAIVGSRARRLLDECARLRLGGAGDEPAG